MTFAYDAGLSTQQVRGGIGQIQCTWVSDSSAGTASGTTVKIVGRLVKVVTVPGTGGTEPTNNYTVTITDGNGLNVLGSCDKTLASNQNQAPTGGAQETYLLVSSYDTSPLGLAVHPVVCDLLTIAVSGAGNSKTGQVFLYYEPVAP